MDFKSLIKAREVLSPLWDFKKAWLRGRLWGRGKKDNPYRASNITIAIGKELVSISQGPDGKLRIHEFSKTENTSLGKDIRKILEKAGLSFEE
jgi:hypothetical protein